MKTLFFIIKVALTVLPQILEILKPIKENGKTETETEKKQD